MAPHTPKNRITAPLITAFLLFAAQVAFLAIPGAWMLPAVLIETLPSPARISILAGVAAALIAFFWWRHRISGITMACGLLAVVILTRVPSIAESPAHWVANVAQVIYYGGELRRQEAELKRQGISPAVAVELLDGFISAASGLALDRTGEIVLPSEKRSAAWQATAGQTELGIDGLEARHIIGDYYAWFHY